MSRSRLAAAAGSQRVPGLGLGLALVTYLAVTLPILDRRGIHWDEHHDPMVAASYPGSPRALVVGSRIDVINVRLPSSSVAMLDQLGLELELRNALPVSCAVGALAIALFGRFGFDDR